MFPGRPVHKPHTLTDFTDFEEVIGDNLMNLLMAKLHGIANRNLLYLCNPRNLRLNPFRFFGFKAEIRSGGFPLLLHPG